MAFRLSDDGHLIGIENFPHLDWNDLIGYAAQKEKLMANTAAFVSGKEANNVLLTGSRGTGKSTAVKAWSHAIMNRDCAWFSFSVTSFRDCSL